MIITTLPLKHNLDILTVEISPFFNYEDEEKIFHALNSLEANNKFIQLENSIQYLIKEKFFYTNIKETNNVEIIKLMCKNLEIDGIVEKNYVNDVINREKISSTSFAFGFAMPHAITENAIESCISVAILKERIMWGENKVKIIFLPTLNEKDRHIMRYFFDWLSVIIADSEKCQTFLKISNYNDFIDQIINLK